MLDQIQDLQITDRRGSTSAEPEKFGVPVKPWCDQCRALEFDDGYAKWGGHEVADPQTGERYIQFDRDKLLAPSWMLTDTLPGLPKLTAAVDKGCEFCGFLKDMF